MNARKVSFEVMTLDHADELGNVVEVDIDDQLVLKGGRSWQIASP